MTRSGLVFIFVALLLLSACKVDNGRSQPYYPPSIEAFHVVDSYGISSEERGSPLLTLDPFRYDGEFEFYWDVSNRKDYTIEFRINNRPRLQGSRLISSDYCGVGLDCGLDGIQYCRYYSDFSMSCDPPGVEDPYQYITYFDDLMITVPQTMYLILDLCDIRSDHCEYRVREVSLE